MTITIGSFVLGVGVVPRAAQFWSQALDYRPRDVGDSTWLVLVPKEGDGPQLALMRSRTQPDSHPRHHLDIYADDRAAEVKRLVAIGARPVPDWDGYDESSDFVVLQDTEGNRFCVVQRPAE